MRTAVTAVVIGATVLAAGYALFVLANGLWDAHQPFGVIAVGVAIAGAFVVQSGRRRRRYGSRYGSRYDHYDDRNRYGSRNVRGRGSTSRSASRSAGGWSSFGNSSRSGGFSSFGRSSSGRSSGGGSKSGRSSGGGSKSGGSSRGKRR